uniref:Uncharacterized protein n=1 Tax=Anguilla anguilla TaxID=7936 RepID=A0A0E9WE37_ANGAN
MCVLFASASPPSACPGSSLRSTGLFLYVLPT